MKRDTPFGLRGRGGQVGVAVLLNRDDIVDAGLADVLPGECAFRWVVCCQLRAEQFDRFAARKSPPQPAVHLLKGRYGVSHLIVVCESQGFQQRVVVPLLGRDAAQFAHEVEVRNELTLLLSDADGRATLVHWGLTDSPMTDWAKEASIEAPAPDEVLGEVIELSAELAEVDSLQRIDKCNCIEVVGVSVYTPPQLEDALRERVASDAAVAHLH